jgi:hypothetical protein
MNDPTFEFHPEALLEAWEARRLYAERNPQTAAAFLAELDHAQEQVIAHPERWPIYLHGTRRYRFRRFPYLLVYPTGVSYDAGSHHRARRGSRQASSRLLEDTATAIAAAKTCPPLGES